MNLQFQLPLIAVQDVERSKRFYCGLFDQQIVLDFGANVTFSGGFAIQAQFAWLTGVAEESVCDRSHNMELYFKTDDIDAFLHRLEAWPEIEYVHPIHTHDWRQRVVRIYDPDKHMIEVGERMEDVARRCLAEGYTAEETARIIQHPLKFVLRAQSGK